MKASEFLTLARTELDDRGWCQGDMENKKGEVCILGAISKANRHIELHKIRGRNRRMRPEFMDQFIKCSNAASEGVYTLQDLARKAGEDDLAAYNDLVAKSKDDALAFFDKAIDYLQKKNN